MFSLRVIGVKPITFLVATVLILLASSLPQAFASVTLAYDNGTLGSTMAPCFGGVRYSLPGGVSSAKILTVLYTWAFDPTGSPGSQNLVVRITAADHVTLLTPAISTTATVQPPSFNSLDVSSSNIVVSGDFWVVVSTIVGGGPALDTSPNVGRSFDANCPGSLATLTAHTETNNWMIRAVVDPITPPPIPEYPIGLPILAIFMALAYGVIRRRAATKKLT